VCRRCGILVGVKVWHGGVECLGVGFLVASLCGCLVELCALNQCEKVSYFISGFVLL